MNNLLVENIIKYVYQAVGNIAFLMKAMSTF